MGNEGSLALTLLSVDTTPAKDPAGTPVSIIKTREEHGNLQFTMTSAKESSGPPVTILDADLDENGKLMTHLADLFKHRFTGGTHPSISTSFRSWRTKIESLVMSLNRRAPLA
jgi:hypothetical protein